VRATSPETYHLVMRPEDREKPDIRAFRDWIVGEMAAWRNGAARGFRPRNHGRVKVV